MSNENTIFNNNESYKNESTVFNNAEENTVYENENTGAEENASGIAPMSFSKDNTANKSALWKKVVIGGVAGLVFGGGATAIAAMTTSDSKDDSTDKDSTPEPKNEEADNNVTDPENGDVDPENKEGEDHGNAGDIEEPMNNGGSHAAANAAAAPAQDVTITVASNGSSAAAAPATPSHTGGSQNIHIEVIELDGDVHLASNVNDDMSFAQAFAAARAECGTSGVFEWHGHLYNTFTVEEWDSLSQAQRDEFAQNVHTNHDTLPVDNMPADSMINSTSEIAYAEDVEVEAYEDSEPEIEVLGVEYNEDLDANVAEVLVDDNQVYLIDVDQDNVFDVLVADTNGDSELSADEFYDISEHNVTVDDLGGFTGPNAPDLASDEDLTYNEGDGTTDYSI